MAWITPTAGESWTYSCFENDRSRSQRLFGIPTANRYTTFQMSQPRRILVVQPNWVGDAVMATPTLRVLRELYPSAQISYLLRRYVKPMYTGMPWVDKLITYRTGRTKAKAGKHLHLEHFAQIVPKLKNKHIVVSHVSRRIGIRKAKALMRKKLGDQQMERITFLMDFEGSTDAGDVESTVPPSEKE